MWNATEAYDSIIETMDATPEKLQPIVAALSDKRRLVFESLTILAATLTEEFEAARQAVEVMMEDRRQHVRFSAILCIGNWGPRDFAVRLIRKGLKDRSSRVRWKSAEIAACLRIKELLPEVEAALGNEADTQAKRSIEFSLKLLRDEYILEQDRDGNWMMTIQVPTGGLSGQIVSASEIDVHGAAAIAKKLMKQLAAPGERWIGYADHSM